MFVATLESAPTLATCVREDSPTKANWTDTFAIITHEDVCTPASAVTTNLQKTMRKLFQEDDFVLVCLA